MANEPLFKKPSVLIIDDSVSICEHLQKTLTQSALFNEIWIAHNGAEGLKILGEHAAEIGLILCDLVMPEMDGFKFLSLKAKKAEFKDIPTILLTSQNSVEEKINAFKRGALDYLTKPFFDEELIARIKVHLKIKSLQEELSSKNLILEELSNTDDLTQLLNRRHFLQILNMEFLRSNRYHLPLTFAMLDIDHFKIVNDTYGHLIGDQVLKELAKTLKSHLRIHDVLGRYGGEEFSIIMPHTDAAGALSALERCRELVANLEIHPDPAVLPQPAKNANHLANPIKITISLGFVCYPHPEINAIDNLIKFADLALYRAKAEGRNQVRRFT